MLNIRLTAAVIFVVLAFLLCFGGSLLTRNLEADLLMLVAEIDTSNTNNEAQKATQQLVQLWDETRDILMLFLDHEQCDRLGSYISCIEFYEKNGDDKSLLYTCFLLSQLLEDLIELEKFSIYNLL